MYLYVDVFVGKVFVVLALHTSCVCLSVGSIPFGKFLLTFFITIRSSITYPAQVRFYYRVRT